MERLPARLLSSTTTATLGALSIVYVVLSLSRTVQGMLMFDKVDSEDLCLLAMCEADSGCVPHGCSIDQNDRIGCGYFRLNIYQYRQCYQPGKREDEDEDIAWINCAEDYHCSANCIKTLASRFKVKCYGKSDCESLARIHDGGANGCRAKNTAFYWRKVRESCGADCLQPAYKRQRL